MSLQTSENKKKYESFRVDLSYGMDVENVFCLIFLCCLVELTISSSNYVAITPKIVLSKNVKTDTGLPETNISIIYEHNNEYVILDLNLNGDLLPKEHFVTYQNLNSEKTIKTFTKTDVDLCHYQVSFKVKIFKSRQNPTTILSFQG